MYAGKTRYQKEQVADDYDNLRFTSLKGRWTDKREKRCLLRMLKAAGVTGKVLDIPCGTGRMTELLVDLGMDITAADVSEAMMKHAKARTAKYRQQIRFLEADIENLEFIDSSFELIVTIRLLHHIPSSLHPKILGELHRVTSKWVVMTFSNKYSIQSARRDLLAAIESERRYSISPRLFRRQVEAVGFSVVKYIPLFPLVSESVFVLLEKRFQGAASKACEQ